MINVNSVVYLKIVEGEYACSRRFPCNHEIVIELLDGRSKKTMLESYKVDILIKSLAQEKLLSSWENAHFEVFSGVLELEFFKNKPQFPTAEEIVTEIFSRNF